MWVEVAIVASMFAIGNILFGHFEERTPKWKRFAKFFGFIALSILISSVFGRFWFFVLIVAALIPPLMIHLWWLPRHGINGWTGEPKDKYSELRGWKR